MIKILETKKFQSKQRVVSVIRYCETSKTFLVSEHYYGESADYALSIAEKRKISIVFNPEVSAYLRKLVIGSIVGVKILNKLRSIIMAEISK